MYCAYIVELKELRKHSNADRLQLCTVFGNTVIVDLSYYEGQKVIFFPVDGQLGKSYAEENQLLRIKNEDGTYSGGYLDAEKRNIKAMKLRGEKSEGLVMPVESLSKWVNINELKIGDKITTLNGEIICQKYIPKRNHSNKSYSSSKSKSNNLKEKYLTFHEHVDTEQLAYNLDRFKPGDTCYITLKMHGCFTGDTRVKKWGENKGVNINKIKSGDIVVGYKDGNLVPSKVKNVFINGKTKEWQEIRYSRKGLHGERVGKIKCTPEHLFWDYKINGYKKAKDIEVGEKISLIKEDWILDKRSKSILLGMYLGDSYYDIQVAKHHNNTATLQFSVKSAHEQYLNYISKILDDFIILDKNEYISGYGTKMKKGHTRYSVDLRKYFDSILDTSSNENKLTEKIIDYFSWDTLMFLYLDDGNLSHSDKQKDRAHIAICDYNDHDANILVKCLQKLGLNNITLYKDSKGYNRIRLNHDSAYIMFEKIKDHVPLCMKYKLPEELRTEIVNINKCDVKKGYSFIECNILSNNSYISKRPSLKYDLETETSNYVVGSLLVHNSSGRSANALMIEEKKQNFIEKLLHKPVEKIESWQPVSGTRRVVLEDFDGGFYGSNEFRKQYHDYFKDKLPKEMCVYYEIVGWVDGTDQTIMGRCANSKIKDKEFSKLYGKETIFSYGCEEGCSDIYVYRMTMTNCDDEVIEIPWETVKIWCERLGVKHVPEFEKFLFTTKEDLMERVEKYYDGPDPIGKTHVREGVVVRIDNKEYFTAYKHKNFNFKVLEGIIKDTSDAPDMEEAQEVVA